MRLKRISWLVMIAFLFSIMGPLVFAPPAEAATMTDLVSEMDLVYNCIDDTFVDGSGKTDKGYMQDARTASQGLADLEYNSVTWAAILNPLVNGLKSTPAGIKAIEDAGGETAVRQTFVNAFSDLSEIYYTSDAVELENRLTAFKNTYRAFFLTLFGNDLTVDKFSSFLIASRTEFRTAINHSLTSEESTLLHGNSLKYALLYGTNEDLINAMPILMKYAMYNTLATADYTDLNQRLSDIGWSVDLLINQYKMIGVNVDPDSKALLGLALASVRSQAKLYDLISDPNATTPIANNAVTCSVGENYSIQLHVMGTDVTAQTEFYKGGATPGAIGTITAPKDTIDFPAANPGTAILVLYRYGSTAPEHDWIAKLTVTVESPAFVYGDVDGGGAFDSADYGYLKLYLLGKINSFAGGANGMLAANVDNTGALPDSADYGYMKLRLLNKIPKFPAEP